MTKEFTEKGAAVAAQEQLATMRLLHQILTLHKVQLLPSAPENPVIPLPPTAKDLREEWRSGSLEKPDPKYKRPQDVLKRIFENLPVEGCTPSWDKKSLIEITPVEEMRLGYLWKMKHLHLDVIPSYLVQYNDDLPTALFGRIEAISILKSFGILRDPTRKYAAFYFDVTDDKRQTFPTTRTIYFSTKMRKNGTVRVWVEIHTDETESRKEVSVDLIRFFPNLVLSFEHLVEFALLAENQADVTLKHRLITV